MKKINWKETLIKAGPISWILFGLALVCALMCLLGGKSYLLLQGGALAAAGALFTAWKCSCFKNTSPVTWILTALLLAAFAYTFWYPVTTEFLIVVILLGAGWLSYLSYRVWVRGLFQKTSPMSWILFILSVLFILIWLYQPHQQLLLILGGLCGVIWLTHISLSAWKRGRMKGFNPFTLLIVLCGVLAVVLTLWKGSIDRVYREGDEPINVATQHAQEALNQYGASEKELKYAINSIAGAMGGVKYNVILTDQDHKVVYADTTWPDTSGSDALRLMTAPGYVQGYDREVLSILVNGEGEVLSAFLLEEDYSGDTGTPTNPSGLTRPSITALPNPTISPTTSVEPDATSSPDSPAPSAEPSDPLYERYFPSFSPLLDQYALDLAENSSINVGLEENMRWISLNAWQGEPIIGLSAFGSETTEGPMIRALNALNEEERARYVEYVGWLRSALEVARNGVHDTNNPNKARMLTGRDGAHLYILYQYDYRALNPVQIRHNETMMLVYGLNISTAMMIPAAIVFLAFWVFVDAKNRGQKNPALWAVLTLIGNAVAFIIYLLVRPQTRVGITGKAIPKGTCPLCGTQLKGDFIACPGCGVLIRSRCKTCGRALENDWSFCPYCAGAVTQAIEEESAKDDQ